MGKIATAMLFIGAGSNKVCFVFGGGFTLNNLQQFNIHIKQPPQTNK